MQGFFIPVERRKKVKKVVVLFIVCIMMVMVNAADAAGKRNFRTYNPEVGVVTPLGEQEDSKYFLWSNRKSEKPGKEAVLPAILPETSKASKWKPDLVNGDKYRPVYVYYVDMESWVNLSSFAAFDQKAEVLRFYIPNLRRVFALSFRNEREANIAVNIIIHGYDMDLPPYQMASYEANVGGN